MIANHLTKKIFFFLLLQYGIDTYAADIVVFSFDRPMQLYALLESMQKYLSGVEEVSIIYRISSPKFERGYCLVKHDFGKYKFFKQSDNPHADFKPLLMKCAFSTSSKWIAFAVDDIILTDHVDLDQCSKILQQTSAYGFYLRLGKNITYCYMRNMTTPVPPSQEIQPGIYRFIFKNGSGDWAYPNSVDFVLYRKSDIYRDHARIDILTPSYEGTWSQHADLSKQGLFFERSKMINIPMNLINEQCQNNRHNHSFSVHDLLAKFMSGYKIDISRFYKIKNNSPHVEYMPTFVKRRKSNDLQLLKNRAICEKYV